MPNTLSGSPPNTERRTISEMYDIKVASPEEMQTGWLVQMNNHWREVYVSEGRVFYILPSAGDDFDPPRGKVPRGYHTVAVPVKETIDPPPKAYELMLDRIAAKFTDDEIKTLLLWALDTYRINNPTITLYEFKERFGL